MATKDLSKVRYHVFLCEGDSCTKRGACDVTSTLRAEIARLGLDEVVHTTRTRCNGRCQDGPIVIVYPDGIWYRDVSTESAAEIVTNHLAEELILHNTLLYQFRAERNDPKYSSDNDTDAK